MARFVALAAALAALVVLAAGCGFGPATEEGRISEAADTYLRSLASGDTAEACEQLTSAARADLEGGCAAALRRIASRTGAGRLDAAADAGVDPEVLGDKGSAVVHELDVRLTLVRVGGAWRIDGGHQLQPA